LLSSRGEFTVAGCIRPRRITERECGEERLGRTRQPTVSAGKHEIGRLVVLEISAIRGSNLPDNEVLRYRVERSKSGWATEYIARIDSSEAALLVLDHYQPTSTASIREIFVLEPYRQQGVGTEVLKFAEARARELGCCKIELEVHPLDASIDKALLRVWYSRHGYERDAGNQDKLQKIFRDTYL
jgi:GNAT superfamily N-acetyltransferase